MAVMKCRPSGAHPHVTPFSTLQPQRRPCYESPYICIVSVRMPSIALDSSQTTLGSIARWQHQHEAVGLHAPCGSHFPLRRNDAGAEQKNAANDLANHAHWETTFSAVLTECTEMALRCVWLKFSGHRTGSQFCAAQLGPTTGSRTYPLCT